MGEEGLAGVTVEGSQTAVGSSANTITGHKLKSNTLAKNYTITYKPGTLTVTQSEKVITVTANSRTWEYDGKEHSDGGYTVRYDGETYTVAAGESQELPTGGLTLTATVAGTVKDVKDSAKDNNKITVVAITDAAGNVVNDQFKTITLVPGTLTITKRGAGEEKVILKAANNAVVYDGQPHGVCLTADGKSRPARATPSPIWSMVTVWKRSSPAAGPQWASTPAFWCRTKTTRTSWMEAATT